VSLNNGFILEFFKRERPALDDVVDFVFKSGDDENRFLELKAAQAIRRPAKPVCKAVSSFANTEGGLVILGLIKEHGEVLVTPVEEDRETVEARIEAKIAPMVRIDQILPLPAEHGHVYLIDVPRSDNPPHMLMAEGIRKYYRRDIFKSVPMSHSEVEAAFLRRGLLSKANVELLVDRAQAGGSRTEEEDRSLRIILGNLGNIPAESISVYFEGVGAARFQLKSQFGQIKTFRLPGNLSAARLLLTNPLFPQERIPAAVLTPKADSTAGRINVHVNGRNVVPTHVSVALHG